MNFFQRDTKSAIEAKGWAQWIAFGPVVFQVARVLRNSGILHVVEESGAAGISLEEITAEVKLPHYGVRVLLESGLGIGLLIINDGKFRLNKTGILLLHNASVTR